MGLLKTGFKILKYGVVIYTAIRIYNLAVSDGKDSHKKGGCGLNDVPHEEELAYSSSGALNSLYLPKNDIYFSIANPNDGSLTSSPLEEGLISLVKS